MAIKHLKEKGLAANVGEHHHSQYVLTTTVKKAATADQPDQKK